MRKLIGVAGIAVALANGGTASAEDLTFNACAQSPVYTVRPDTQQQPAYILTFNAKAADGSPPLPRHSLTAFVRPDLSKATLDSITGSDQAGWTGRVSLPSALFEAMRQEVYSGQLLAVHLNWNGTAPKTDFQLDIWRIGDGSGRC